MSAPGRPTGAELLFELISQRYERVATLITSNLPFDEWTETLGSERLTGALLDRITHHVNIPYGNLILLSRSKTGVVVSLVMHTESKNAP